MIDSTVKTKIIVDDDTIHVSRVQDVEGILDGVAELRNSQAFGSSEMRHAGFIPFVEVERYLNETGISLQEFNTDDRHIAVILNDPSFKKLRIWEGKI